MLSSQPTNSGHFGPYGGKFVPEVLMSPLEELENTFLEARKDPKFQAELDDLLHNYAGRPTPLYYAKRLSDQLGGARIYLKREDLLHTGAHKINNCLGQALLAKRMGKNRIIAETGAGQHGVATATVCALFGFDCTVYMGEEDMRRQRLNVFRMRLLGAKVMSASPTAAARSRTPSAKPCAIGSPMSANTHYLLGSALGSHPYPLMVREFHRVMGVEARRADPRSRENRLPDAVFACVGGGSNAIGIFHPFVQRCQKVASGRDRSRRYAVPGLGRTRGTLLTAALPACLQGAYSYLLQDEDGQISLTQSISAGLDYAMIGPEHAQLLRPTGAPNTPPARRCKCACRCGAETEPNRRDHPRP